MGFNAPKFISQRDGKRWALKRQALGIETASVKHRDGKREHTPYARKRKHAHMRKKHGYIIAIKKRNIKEKKYRGKMNI
ncbi:MAG: hypothetical protein J1E57_08455 [Prevotella sp.]|nr:hypothetical protein [Prevotella sp.]